MNKSNDFEQLFSITMQFGKLISRQTQATHEEKKATMLQLVALDFLKEEPNRTVSDFAYFLRLSKSSATQLAERLVDAGLVKRIHDNKDGRIIRLEITESGNKEYRILRLKIAGKMKKIFAKIPAKDVRELIRIYIDLVETLKKER